MAANQCALLIIQAKSLESTKLLWRIPFPCDDKNTISPVPAFGPAMAINGRWNKPIGPGGGTRRLHQKQTASLMGKGLLLMGAK